MGGVLRRLFFFHAGALVFFLVFLVMLYVATGRFSYVVIGLALLAVGAVGAYKFLSHVQVRFQVWVDPFKDAQGQGYQIVQSLFSLADGGLVGVGIGNGMANNIPVVESDFCLLYTSPSPRD